MNIKDMIKENPIRIGEEGYVRFTRVMAEIMEDGDLLPVSDLSPVNDAKASFNKRSDTFGEKEAALLETMREGNHTSPFRGTLFQFEICAPLMIMRQWMKYAIGSDHDETLGFRDPFLAWNEVSRRYVTRKPTFYTPGADGWRKAPEERRQGSAGPLEAVRAAVWEDRLKVYQAEGIGLYTQAIAGGVAPEQARLFLPAYGLYITSRWTCSLQAVCHVLNQRLNHDAQGEFQVYARAVYTFVNAVAPNAVNALILPDVRAIIEGFTDWVEKPYLQTSANE